MDGMTNRGETSGHTQRLRSGDLGTLMRTGYHRTMEYVQARLEQLGFDDVRPAHMAIFQNLGPEGARIGELAERAKLTNQSVGYLVDYLEEHGYVERRPDPTNRRATLVCFTERGWDEADACAKILDQLDEELTTRMGAERLEQLQALLAEATAALHASKLAIPAPRGRSRSRLRHHRVLPSSRRIALANPQCGRHHVWSIARLAWTSRTGQSARCNPRGLHRSQPHGIDLISYQNARKGCAAVADQVQRTMSEYARWRINMRAGEILISAESGVGRQLCACRTQIAPLRAAVASRGAFSSRRTERLHAWLPIGWLMTFCDQRSVGCPACAAC